MNVLETFPRDELFQIEPVQLQALERGHPRPRDAAARARVRPHRPLRPVRLPARLCPARPLYVGRARAHRRAAGRGLQGPHRRVLSLLHRRPAGARAVHRRPLRRRDAAGGRGGPGARDQRDPAHLGRRLADAIAALGSACRHAAGEIPGGLLSRATRKPSPPSARSKTSHRIERLGPDLPVAIDFYREPDAPAHRFRAAVYRFGGPINLSQRVPLLENMGFVAIDERSYHVHPRLCRRHARGHAARHGARDRRRRAHRSRRPRQAPGGRFLAVFHGQADNDSFNRLVVAAGADWRTVATLRAYAAFLRQLGSPFGPRYIADTLYRHAGVARDLLELFHLRFDPARKLDVKARQAAEEPIRQRIEGALAAVPSLDEDRILRQFLNLVGATVRTNFFQAGAGRDSRRRPSPSSSTATRWTPRRSRAPTAKSGSIRRASRACTCASRRSRAAASAGRTGRRISAPRCWASFAPRWSRTP